MNKLKWKVFKPFVNICSMQQEKLNIAVNISWKLRIVYVKIRNWTHLMYIFYQLLNGCQLSGQTVGLDPPHGLLIKYLQSNLF